MKYYLYTDTLEFERIKKLAQAGTLKSLKLVWSWKYFNFIFRAEYICVIDELKPLLDKIQLNWLKFQQYSVDAMHTSCGIPSEYILNETSKS